MIESWHPQINIENTNRGRMEDPSRRESAPLLPRNLAWILAAVLVATLACMAYTAYLTDSGMPSWIVPLSAVVFLAAILLCFAARMDVEVSGDGVRVTYLFRRREYPRDQIIDKRFGDLENIRNYSQWNLKGVSHKSYTRVGEEGGVALKLKGKRVVVFSSSDPEGMYGIVPVEEVDEIA